VTRVGIRETRGALNTCHPTTVAQAISSGTELWVSRHNNSHSCAPQVQTEFRRRTQGKPRTCGC
jgi:hypothetical protein